MGDAHEVVLRLTAADADDEELAELTARLREELLELDVDRVEAVTAGEAPPGTRAGGVVELGALLVGLVQRAGPLAALVTRVKAWASSGGQRSVKLELDGDVLEVTGISSAAQDELIRAWLARHGDAAGPLRAAQRDAAG